MNRYEELYYQYKRMYYDAVDEKNNMSRKCAKYEPQVAQFSCQLDEQKAKMKTSGKNIKILEKLHTKCLSILDKEFVKMSNSLSSATEEYQKVFSSDNAPVSMVQVYDDDVKSTKLDLNDIVDELKRRISELQSAQGDIQKEIDKSQYDLDNAKRELNNARSDRQYYQSKEDCYYTQMNYYYKKWMDSI